MIVMLLGMRGMQQGQAASPEHPAPQAAGAPLTREQQLAQFRSQLMGLGEQQAALAAQIERLEMTEGVHAQRGRPAG
jgi:hypothetical protein